MKSGKTRDSASQMKLGGGRLIFIWVIALSATSFSSIANDPAAAKIRINAIPVNLGAVKLDGESAPKTVIIKNTGQSDLLVSSISISGPNASDFSYGPPSGCLDPIQPNASCSLAVKFRPTSSFGQKRATINISSNDPKRQIIGVKLLGRAPPPKISASAMTVNFAAVDIGNTSVPRQVVIRNTGLSDLVIGHIGINGRNAHDFRQTNACSIIAKGASCAANITFAPSLPSKERANLTISSNDPKSVLTIKLNGKGTGGPNPSATDGNVMEITVNGFYCSIRSYINKPCVRVTICTPGTSACQTIDDILLDTGSAGLRVFQQALSIPLTPETAGSNGSFAECVQYADGSSDWGSVQLARVILGNEPAIQLPVQVIDSTFGSPPVACRNADQGPTDAGFNGILGVGLFAHDCGQRCATTGNNGMYYVCNGGECQSAAAPLSNQVQNPVALLPQDNNGVIVELPAVPPGGVPSVNGYLVLGIGTRANNQPSGVTSYTTDPQGDFTTNFGGVSYPGFLDTGSNGLFFPSSSANPLPDCASPNSSWFCPSSTKQFTAVNAAASGSPSGTVAFAVGNYDSLTRSANSVFSEVGGSAVGDIDWGLPFFFGRNIYIGLEGKGASLGSGMYWAY